MEAAIFGLVGVIVGGGLTLGADLYKRRREERAAFRSAARVVLRELEIVHRLADNLIANNATWPRPQDMPPWSWSQHEAVLARRITDWSEWRYFHGAFAGLSFLTAFPNARLAKGVAGNHETLGDLALAARESVKILRRYLGDPEPDSSN